MLHTPVRSVIHALKVKSNRDWEIKRVIQRNKHEIETSKGIR